MSTPFFDCSHQVTALRRVPKNRCAWLANELVDDDWIVKVNAEMENELDTLAGFLSDNPVQKLQRGHVQYLNGNELGDQL